MSDLRFCPACGMQLPRVAGVRCDFARAAVFGLKALRTTRVSRNPQMGRLPMMARAKVMSRA